MSSTESDDPLWQTAWRWVMREHEQALAPDERAELLAWLAADPQHRARYDEAARLKLLASLLPTVHVPPDAGN